VLWCALCVGNLGQVSTDECDAGHAVNSHPSKSRVNKAGDRLAEWWTGSLQLKQAELRAEVDIVWAWRQQHAYPLALTMPGLRNWVEAESSLGVKPAQRLKRLPQIVHKLARHPGMKLARMQDIGGCRAVLADAREVEKLARRIRHRWKPVRSSDYRDTSRSDTGYRALHLIVEKRDRRISKEPRAIEVQLRTEEEHDWAEEVARTGGRLGYDLKDGEGPDELVEYFRMASDLLWLQAGDYPVEEGFSERFDALREQVRPYFQANP
jgi:putative GTP pyrophosphokinase